MRHLIRSFGLGMVAVACTACGDGSTSSPVAPPPPTAGVTVAAITITGPSTGSVIYQLQATARLSDGTTREVTTTALWESSNVALAVVSSGGVFTPVGTGMVEFRATYLGVTGALQLAMIRPPEPTTFALTGTVREVDPTQQAIAGARVQMMTGPDAGAFALTDTGGLFRLSNVSAGRVTVQATKGGYQAWEIAGLTIAGNTHQDVWMYPTPPTNAAGTVASARCSDGTWSWEPTRAAACATHGGVEYGVCPGPLCEQQLKATESRN